MNAPRRRYEEFHGRKLKKVRERAFHYPRNLIILGKAVAVEYECSKYNGGGDGKRATYRHEFETPAYVCMDERGKKQIYIIGRNIRVTEAGIEN
jgi:hypothetical protein